MAEDENKPEEPATETGEPATSDTTSAGGGSRAEAPKAFWWRALLMVAAVVILFVVIRDLAKDQQPHGAARPAEEGVPSANLTGEISKLVAEGEVIVEEAPTDEPTVDNPAPVPGYSYPPQQPCYPQYHWSVPYGYWGPFPYFWYPPEPEEPTPEQEPEAQ